MEPQNFDSDYISQLLENALNQTEIDPITNEVVYTALGLDTNGTEPQQQQSNSAAEQPTMMVVDEEISAESPAVSGGSVQQHTITNDLPANTYQQMTIDFINKLSSLVVLDTHYEAIDAPDTIDISLARQASAASTKIISLSDTMPHLANLMRVQVKCSERMMLDSATTTAADRATMHFVIDTINCLVEGGDMSKLLVHLERWGEKLRNTNLLVPFTQYFLWLHGKIQIVASPHSVHDQLLGDNSLVKQLIYEPVHRTLFDAYFFSLFRDSLHIPSFSVDLNSSREHLCRALRKDDAATTSCSSSSADNKLVPITCNRISVFETEKTACNRWRKALRICAKRRHLKRFASVFERVNHLNKFMLELKVRNADHVKNVYCNITRKK